MQGKTDMSYPWHELILEHMFKIVKVLWFGSPRKYPRKYRGFAGVFVGIPLEHIEIVLRMDRGIDGG